MPVLSERIEDDFVVLHYICSKMLMPLETVYQSNNVCMDPKNKREEKNPQVETIELYSAF